MEEGIFLAYDQKKMKVGCVLIQAGMGGNSEVAQEFRTDLWELAPSDDMKVYHIKNREELDRIITMTEKFHE